MVKKITSAEYKVLIKEMRAIREEIGRLDHDIARDRQEYGDLKISVDGMASGLNELRKEVKANGDKVKNGLTDAVEPVIQEARELTKEIKKKRFIPIKFNWFGLRR